MVVILFGKDLFKAETFDDMVMQLKLESWLQPKTKKEFMEGLANRAKVWHGKRIRYSNAEQFIRELARISVIKILSAIEEGIEI